MYSMTGFGKAEYNDGGLVITVEIKSVNNRFLDINAKYPRLFNQFDDVIRKSVQSRVARGRIDLYITYADSRDRQVALDVDIPLAKSYAQAARRLAEEVDYPFPDALDLKTLMRMPDVITVRGETTDDKLGEITEKLVTEACENLNRMRLKEGEKLCAEILLHLAEIERLVDEIAARAPEISAEYREKLRQRITEYLENVPLDEGRLLNEVAFFADKSNIDEEIARLRSHISQFRKICGGEVAGRKLDFLIQEFNREANTICSKANDVTLTSKALALKSEIEKIREQIQNLE